MSSPDHDRGVTPLSSEDLKFCVGLFKALTDPMRLHLLNLLATKRRPMTVVEITDHVPIGQSTVSYHLKALAGMRFVRSKPAGASTLYEFDAHCREHFDAAAYAIWGQP